MTTKNETKKKNPARVHDPAAWRQVFCAALTGILAAAKEEPTVGDADDPFRDDAYDAVSFASQVADEAFECYGKKLTE